MIKPALKPDDARITLQTENRNGSKRPVLHVLMADGRVTEFRGKGVVIPETGNNGPGDDEIYAVLVNGRGEQYYTAEGEPVIVAVPVVRLGTVVDTAKPLTWKQLADSAGVHVSSVKRAVKEGALPMPARVPGLKRAVRFDAAAVRPWIERVKRR